MPPLCGDESGGMAAALHKVRREEDVLEVFLAFAAREGLRDARDVGVVDEDAPRLADEGDVDAADLVLPSCIAVLMQ